MKYNKSLDLIACAILNFKEGKVLTAGKLFAEACGDASHASALAAIEASNAKGFIALQAASKTSAYTARKRVRATDELDFLDEDGEEVEAAGDDAEWPFTASDDADADDDLVVDEDGGELDLEASDEFTLENDDADDIEEAVSATANRIAQARFVRALANMRAAAAKKKPAAKKPAARKK